METMTISEFAKLNETKCNTIIFAIQKKRLNVISERKPNGVMKHLIVIDELAENYDPDYTDKPKYKALKYEINHRGMSVPQPCWVYRNDCMGGHIMTETQEHYDGMVFNRPVTKSNLSVFTESPCFSEGD